MCEDAPVEKVLLRRIMNGGEQLEEMTVEKRLNDFKYFSAKTVANEPVIQYQFFILSDQTIYYYNQLGITTYIPDRGHDFKILTEYNKPQWATGAVFYQIFCDRFCNGNPDNDVVDGEYIFDGHPTSKYKEWNSPAKEYEEGFCLDFYGGDLEGVKEKIPYLKELGVTALYINPIFYAATNHKYDCLDYFMVDPHFGGDKALAELSDELHKNGMSYILDVSINHTGTAHKWFNKEGIFFDKSEGAYNNPKAKERNYYFFDDKNNYKAWFDVPTLPTLNYTSEELRQILFKSDNSLVKKWLMPPFNMDGWRFDVADVMARYDKIQLAHEIWPMITKSIKETNSSAYILAEDWADCSDFLQGGEWDSAMNYYGSGRPIRQFAGDYDLYTARNQDMKAHPYKMTARDLAHRVNNHLSRLPEMIKDVQFNLLDSHDTPRLHNNPDVTPGAYDGAVKMLYSLPGAVNVYYGDEIALDGHIKTNEGCRYPMDWEKAEKKDCHAYKLYSSLSHLKQDSEAMKNGAYRIVFDEGYIFSSLRFTEDEAYMFIWSRETEEKCVRIPLDVIGAKKLGHKPDHRDILGDKVKAEIDGSDIVITIPADTAYIFKL